MKFNVTIGDDVRKYVVHRVHAPAAYDGFGTFEIGNNGDFGKDLVRWVMINEEHALWQIGRYASGGFHVDEPDICEGYVQELLWTRLVAGKETL